MKFVIWGLGYLGKTLIDCLKENCVKAIVESDLTKTNQKYHGIDVISPDIYIKEYSKYPIIITPAYQFRYEISKWLMEKNIFHYVYGNEFPPNIYYNGKLGLECYQTMIGDAKEVCLYGINAFSLLLYLLFYQRVEKIYFALEPFATQANQRAVIELLQLNVIDNKESAKIKGLVCITTHEKLNFFEKHFKGNQVIDAFRYADMRCEYRNNKLEKFKGIYSRRKRCFVVATGPSLTMDDLDMLERNGEFSFSVNGICKVKTKWKPNVYVVMDGKFFLENQQAIKEYDCDVKLLPDDDIDYWKESNEGEYKIHRSALDAYDTYDFSEDIAQIINAAGTVTVGCVQIAVYMGFKEIYLLGTDCNYSKGSTNNHFGGDEKPDIIDHSVSEMINGYKMCFYYAEAHNIKIYNATRGGMLEVFPRVNFDDLFNESEK